MSSDGAKIAISHELIQLNEVDKVLITLITREVDSGNRDAISSSSTLACLIRARTDLQLAITNLLQVR